MSRFLVDHKGRVIERSTNAYLGKIEHEKVWFPLDKWGVAIAGPSRVRELSILTVIRNAGLTATLRDLPGYEPYDSGIHPQEGHTT